ncbi:DUF2771 domain-containing protein [Corynebacterium lizhenjunii]|uniref:DUF2771 domain-containing protein n=1 Tax=Corynebacterium lizhenjunii TaxID=2709394 RepID=A0A7T0KFT1_9CORY|nr:DUF2771 domain-containing protein [Corynebacterium lizhenjunii]QPK79754.1 DUF2771 domain-containing protein [Corynebacterium lizhenjunii]
MATRKEAQRKSLLQLLALVIAVVVIIVGAVLVQNWLNSRPGKDPAEVSITAQVGDESLEVFPYLSCEPGTQCPEGTVPHLEVGADQTLVLELPEDIARHQWKLLTIYDDPAANDEQLHGAGETTRVEIPGSVAAIEASSGKPARLAVVEVSTVLIGTDADGEETPKATVWSLSTLAEFADAP